uniref:Uncharacterized protein n=1 Tax=viral metagenome TaxID=1070528 RepID=A0A6C0EC23_9ZZZZ
MNYKYPPLYKYAAYLIIVYMFLRHQKIMQKNVLLINSIILTLIVATFDYLFVVDHPIPTDKNKVEMFDDVEDDDDDEFVPDELEEDNDQIHGEEDEFRSRMMQGHERRSERGCSDGSCGMQQQQQYNDFVPYNT